ncbi:hypothetical protein BT63DRAFT_290456 [Microthyrium microscopicum]|uniref:protein kinase C n=1 Tax=Microthyrium microscopicum TaxID=703497 RepID=A0A6A6U8C3_9PEZI|nr:hypothetical protein BT63DRAFT_290456 [Microthyrium microscopicum]
MSSSDDELVRTITGKIEREKTLITAANQMRQSTTNPLVLQGLDTKIRDGRKNIEYLESRLRDHQEKVMNSRMGDMNLNQDGGYGASGYDQQGQYGQQQYGPDGLAAPAAPYARSGPGPGIPKPRPNYSKLDLIKYDTPHLGPRIQLMLSQLEFKLSVEKQYKEGIDKMSKLYQLEGDRKSKQDAENKGIESNQKIQLLKQALRRYADVNIPDFGDDEHDDDDSVNVPSQRKPLTGRFSIKIHAVADVDHAATGRFSRGPETFVIVKVEDNFKVRTKGTRNGRWEQESHDIDVDKANEIELTVYDRNGEQAMPIGMLWIRISDIVEEMRRKKIESEFNSNGWVSANQMEASGIRPDIQFQPPPNQQGRPGAPSPRPTPPSNQPAGPVFITAWFAVEPVGRIQLTISFNKQNRNKQQFDLGLGRQGAVRQKKEEVHEQYGHKFVQQQFFSVMRCALCGEFLKNAAGMQCADCKFTCHKNCYKKVVTKCITQSNAETDPDEGKINHRIPHRWNTFANLSANWCCHCGYMLPLGKSNCRKCSECALTCHAACTHFVPDFCGMSMEKANMILSEIQNTRRRTGSVSMTNRRLRPGQQQLQQKPTPPTPSDSQGPPGHYAQPSQASLDAARASYQSGQSQGPPSPGRPQGARTESTPAAAAAAAALAGRTGTSPPKNPQYGRTQSDYGGSQGQPGYGTQSPYQQPAQTPDTRPAYNPQAYASYEQSQQAQQYQQYQQQQQQAQYAQQAQQPGQYQPQAAAHQQSYGQPQLPQIQQPQEIPQQAVAAQSQVQQPQRDTPSAMAQGTGRRIGLDHFNFLAVLGKGNFGKVMLAETKATKKLYAIKVLKKEFIIENDEVESTRSEKRVFLIANKDRHPFLLNLHACFQTETRVYFVSEYISGGDLMLHIQRGTFGTKRAQFYAAEVCLALKYFHENGVIYRDLKLDNILLTMDGHIKIADYGLCKEDMWYGSTTSTFCGTPEFMAPEILLDKKYGRAVDWWAFGVLIYQMLLQQSPFRGEDEDEIYDAILADEPLYPIAMARDSVSILQKLLIREPELRLGAGPTDAQEVMSQPFFRNINWDDVYNKRIQPPFIPTIQNATDTSNFDSEFTSVTPVLTPVQSVLSQAMQEEFRGFSYSGDFD